MEQIFWYIYAAFIATSTIALIIHGGYRSFLVKIDLVVSIITWIGLFGYITSNQILTPFVWKIVFWTALLWDIVFALVFRRQLEDEREPMGAGGKAFILLFTAAFMAPLYYALFHICFLEKANPRYPKEGRRGSCFIYHF